MACQKMQVLFCTMNKCIVGAYKVSLCLLRMLPAEFSHSVFIFTAKRLNFLLPKMNFPQREVDFFGKTIKNPCGVAAGVDKNAEAIEGLFKMGFGFVEVGTVTPNPQYGNKKPRLFRNKKHKSLLNFMGFPNDGCDEVLKRVIKFKRVDGQALGVNIGRNKDGGNEDYLYLVRKFYKFCDYIAINVSSPNTPNLRDTMNSTYKLQILLLSIKRLCVKHNIPTPILLKISPDVNNLQEIYDVACECGISGFILTNTTSNKQSFPLRFSEMKMGGVSGGLLKKVSEGLLQEFSKINIHSKFVISCGGICDDDEVMSRISIGANAIQIYTPLIYGAFL